MDEVNSEYDAVWHAFNYLQQKKQKNLEEPFAMGA